MIAIERRFLPILAAAGAIILLHQGLDLVSVADAADLATPTARMGLVAVLSTRIPTLLAADACLIVAAVLAPWARFLAVLALVHLVVGLAALAEAPFFLADAGHMVDRISAPELTSYRISVARMLVILVAAGLSAIIVAGSLVGAGRSVDRTPA